VCHAEVGAGRFARITARILAYACAWPSAPLYYYLSNSSRAATVLCGAGWQPAADCGCPLGAARRAELACARDDLAPGSPEYSPRLGCSSAAPHNTSESTSCAPDTLNPAPGGGAESLRLPNGGAGKPMKHGGMRGDLGPGRWWRRNRPDNRASAIAWARSRLARARGPHRRVT
jgi:hypothetical protein